MESHEIQNEIIACQVAAMFELSDECSAMVLQETDLTADKHVLEETLSRLDDQRQVGLKSMLAVAINAGDTEQLAELTATAHQQAINGLKRRLIRREVTTRNRQLRRDRYHV